MRLVILADGDTRYPVNPEAITYLRWSQGDKQTRVYFGKDHYVTVDGTATEVIGLLGLGPVPPGEIKRGTFRVGG